MKIRFTCKNCGKSASQLTSMDTPFVHTSWYIDRQGLVHGCIYCRSCGAVHDTVVTILGGIKLIFGRNPAQVVNTYEFPHFKQLLQTGTYDRLPRVVANAMIEDGRLSKNEDLKDWWESEDSLGSCSLS